MSLRGLHFSPSRSHEVSLNEWHVACLLHSVSFSLLHRHSDSMLSLTLGLWFPNGGCREIEKHLSEASTCFRSREGNWGHRCIPWHRMKKTNRCIPCGLDSDAISPLEPPCQGLKHSSEHSHQNHLDHPLISATAATSPTALHPSRCPSPADMLPNDEWLDLPSGSQFPFARFWALERSK